MSSAYSTLLKGRWEDEESESLSFADRWKPCEMRPAKDFSFVAASDVQSSLVDAFTDFAKTVRARANSDLRLGILERVIVELRQKISDLETRRESIVVVNSLDDSDIILKKTFCVLVTPDEEEFQASFLDANLNATGETRFEAIELLKDIIIENFKFFHSLDQKKLGPMPKKQLRILSDFIQMK